MDATLHAIGLRRPCKSTATFPARPSIPMHGSGGRGRSVVATAVAIIKIGRPSVLALRDVAMRSERGRKKGHASPVGESARVYLKD